MALIGKRRVWECFVFIWMTPNGTGCISGDSALKVPGVSAMHNHPWDLISHVVAGVYKQHRFVEPTEALFVPEEFN